MAVAEPQRARSGPTHEVLNQVPPLEGYNLFERTASWCEALEREGGGWARRAARGRSGGIAGGEALEWGGQANENPPVLRTHDRFGHRIDEVEFHPAWHAADGGAVSHGLHAAPVARPAPGRARRARGAVHVMAQAEAGHLCPISMTYAGVPALRASPSSPRSGSRASPRTPTTRAGARRREGRRRSSGMAMTEKQGGSDVRANTTRAEPLGGGGPGARVRDHRAQVVLLGADVRRVPRARADRRRAVVLPAAALSSRRHAQPLPHPAPEGQARQPLQRLERGRVRRRLGADGRRGGPRRRRPSSRWSTTRGSTA